MNGNEIRNCFFNYFQKHEHVVIPSSRLVPDNDPTLLFTNAGMNQFKAIFLGEETPESRRAVSSQKCVRAGGKHNDLENVGRTARHHTFFEMLGNFSFGDYFKEKAIQLAWDFVTNELKLSEDRLLVTVYAEDDEAYDIWRTVIGLPEEKIIRIATSDNFWSMGSVGPCGPCSELFYDHGADVPGGPPGSEESEGERFVEIWNLVFMQYNRDEEGTLTPLPHPCIDTGAGLERLATILQNKRNNFDTDLFQPIIQETLKLAGIENPTEENLVSLRVIADHIRSVCFLIGDGVLPSNEGRGYVLRRIMRRSMRHGRLLGLKNPFLAQLVPVLNQMMGAFFPEIASQQKTLIMIIKNEEKRFATTLDIGLKILEAEVANLDEGDSLKGETLFTLYDTYGFPVDLTEDIVRDRNISLDMEGFERCMREQQERARAAWSGSGDKKVSGIFFQLNEIHGPTHFVGYTETTCETTIQAIVVDGKTVESLEANQEGMILTRKTPFYAESGGQLGDTGCIVSGQSYFEVKDTRKPAADMMVHVGMVKKGQLNVADVVTLEIDTKRRHATQLHHSATHFLHHTLREVLGFHVKQAGSQVGPERLRFDFTHFQGLTLEQLGQVERDVNELILNNSQQETRLMTPDEAVSEGAVALFGEKYGKEVRVVKIGISLELCGGTHVQRSGDIGQFRILSEGAIAAGIRRIEGVCGLSAYECIKEESMVLRQTAGLLKVKSTHVLEGVERVLSRVRLLEQEVEKYKSKLAGSVVADLILKVQDVGGIPLLATEITGVDANALRSLVDQLKDKLHSAVVLLALTQGQKVTLVAGVTKDLHNRVKAGSLIGFVAPMVGGRGGGKPDMAQGGGNRPEQLTEALVQVTQWIKEQSK